MHVIGNNKKLPDTKTYQNQYRVFGDKAIIFTTKASNGIYNFRMWIPEEQLYYRKSLRTKLLSDALTLGEQEVLSLLELAPFTVIPGLGNSPQIASDPLTVTAKVEFPALFYCFSMNSIGVICLKE
jgi:hypothetical protein